MSEIENLHEKVLVNSILFESLGKSSSVIDAFSGWILAGFAVVTAFLITNYSALPSNFFVNYIKAICYIFLVALVLGVIEKLLALIISAASSGAAVGRELAVKNLEMGFELDFSVVFHEAERAILPPMRYFVRRSFKKASLGDLTATARTFTIMVQVQGFLALMQVGMVIFAAVILLSNVAL